jgi:hypothetical protein
MLVIDTDLEGEALREANIKEPLEGAGWICASVARLAATLSCRSNWRRLYGRFKGATVLRAVVSVGKRLPNWPFSNARDVLLANGRLRQIRMPLAVGLSQLLMATAKQS